MKKHISLLILVLIVLLSLTACSKTSVKNIKNTTVTAQKDMFADGDYENESETSCDSTITLSASSITLSDTSIGSASGSTLTITSKGTYYVTGSLTDGQIIVNVKDDENVTLLFNNVTITNKTLCAVYFINGNKLSLQFEGSNSFTTTSTFTTTSSDNIDGVIFAKDDLCIKGDGSITIKSSDHGIVAKDDLKIMGSTITVNAKSKGIDANNSVRISDGTLNITSGTDGIHIEDSDDTSKGFFYMENGDITIVSSLDGISSYLYTTIVSGDIDIETGSGSTGSASSSLSYKGIKSNGDIQLGSVKIDINSQDDAIHSNSNILINGTNLTIKSGDDAIHADAYVNIYGGNIDITKSYEGIEGQYIIVDDGTISVVASDDGFNAAGGNDSSSTNGRIGQNSFASSSTGSLTINGGTITVNSQGDGLDANGAMYISGGYIIVYGPTNNGNGAIDYDTTFKITGGTLIAFGMSGMSMNASDASQGSILYNGTNTSSANSNFYVEDSNGNILYEVTSLKSFNSVLISASNIKKGSTYTLTIGSSSVPVTMSSYIVSVGSQSMGGGMSGGMPRR